uniref:ATP-dependent DNA helicase n=2 Tax=Anopheles albimanus TaxID=7167 RepID=A0A182F499_ANOAL
MLTRFFELAACDAFARTLTYQDVPAHYRYVKPSRAQRIQWIRRIRENEIVVGRMVYCPISHMERYCLRLLLCYRRGPTSYEDLRTVDGVLCASYQHAATLAGLLNDESEWERTLQEAVSFQMPSQLRQLFALILSEGKPSNPLSLWESYAAHLCEDYHRQHRERYTAEESEQNRLLRAAEHFSALMAIDQYLRGTTPPKTLEMFPNMPQLAEFAHLPTEFLQSDRAVDANALLGAERSYGIDALDNMLDNVHRLNADQRAVYDQLIQAVDRSTASEQAADRATEEERCHLYFLDGPGGTGKSFLLEIILAYTRRQSKVALAVASSGIAALLLTGGKTAHSTFKLPFILDENSICNIPAQSQVADLMRETSLIVWDEASMSNRFALEAVDRTLQDIVG